MSKSEAVSIEDRIVRIVANRASLGGARPSDRDREATVPLAS
jgi:hypothetical protein